CSNGCAGATRRSTPICANTSSPKNRSRCWSPGKRRSHRHRWHRRDISASAICAATIPTNRPPGPTGARRPRGRHMNHPLRARAPIPPAGWQELEKEATRPQKATLAARRLVDFVGPQGWNASAVGLGRSDGIAWPTEVGNGRARLRKVLPLVELRVPFEMNLADLDDFERGAKHPDTHPLLPPAPPTPLPQDP